MAPPKLFVRYAMSFFDPISSRKALSWIIGVLTVLMPLVVYSDYRSIYGEFAPLKLFSLTTLGMMISFYIYVGQENRVAAIVSGLISGICGTALFFHAPAFIVESLRVLMPWRLPDILFFIGAIPGFLVLGWTALPPNPSLQSGRIVRR